MTPQATLEGLTWEGAERRYPEGMPDKVKAILRHELGLIQTLEYAPYFLTVNSIVRFARSQDILCQGRGSAANSAVCYVLGHHLYRPGAQRPAVRAIRLRGTARAAGHRCGFRTRATRDRPAVGLRHLWPGPFGALLHGHPLSDPRRHPRRRQGARPARRPHQDAVVPDLGLVGRGPAQARRGAEPQPRRPALAPDAGPGPPAHGCAAPPFPAPRRLRPDPRPARRAGADRAGGDEGPPGDRVGQGRHRRPEVHEGRLPGAGHDELHEARPGPTQRPQGRSTSISPPSPPRIHAPTR